MSRRRALALGLALIVGVGCATPPTEEARRATADHLADRQDWQAATITAGRFDIAAWLPRRIVPGNDLTLYIEGDGLAWLARDVPSSDPTPLMPMGLQLALAQPAGNAVYLARPCQYTSDAEQCGQRYWTTRRFAPEVIDAMEQAVDNLKARFRARQLTLVGYSGGATVAALLAARRTDVVRLVTVAGNLDPRAWAAFHRASPLTGSLDPVDEREALAGIPQWHFVGGRDHVVPPVLVQRFAAGLPQARVVVFAEYDHQCCWAENWRVLWQEIH